MSLLRRREMCLLLVVVTTALGCSGSGSPGFSDYSGTAYPSHSPMLDGGPSRLGYVANRNSDTVSVLDLDAMSLIGTVAVGRDPVDIDGPRHVVLDSADGLAYVALSYPFSTMSSHALSQGGQQRSGYIQALNLPDLGVAGDVRVDPDAADIAFSPDSGVLAVSHYDVFRALQSDVDQRRANLVLVDPASAIATDEATANRMSLCTAPTSLAFNGDGSRVFVACTGEDTLVVVDVSSAQVLTQVPAGAFTVNQPYGLVADLARGRLLVSNKVSAAVSIFDMSDAPTLLSTLAVPGVPGVPYFATWLSDTTVAVPFQTPGGASLFDVTSGEQLVQISYTDDQCTNPVELSTTSDGRLRLVCEGDHYTPGAVVELDPETLAIIKSVSVGIYPERMSIFEP